jgi:5-oxoprolinase (ATP-hydrolysing)
MHISIDRGGTFTDIYAQDAGVVYTQKLLSHDPDNYRDASSEGIRRILEEHHNCKIDKNSIPTNGLHSIRLGTTVATNALLEHKGARTALFITKGLGDLLEIGYQNRADLFKLNIEKSKLLYEHVFEVDERVMCMPNNKFKVLKSVNPTLIFYELKKLKSMGIESIAICLMHAYGFSEHEEQVLKMAKNMGFKQVTASHELLPTIKIVERGDTTVVDAYLTPHIREYIELFKSQFVDNLADVDLSFMQSHGGLCESDRFSGSNAILSGPAGGVVGVSTLYQDTPLIGFDMGGTSSDVCRYDGGLELSYENNIAGVTLRTPQLDILTVAAGGGSRLFYKNGLFVVGPQSAGAHPGPVCYKKGGMLSITDANVVLGRVVPEHFPAIFGKNEDEILDRDASIKAFEQLAVEINSERETPLSVMQIAQGFIDVANDAMSKPIREVSIAQGHDITKHKLVCFGGAAGQHACAIAKSLDIKEVIIHKHAGILSAYGIHHANNIRHFQKVMNQSIEAIDNANTVYETLLSTHKSENETAKMSLRVRYEGSETSVVLDACDDYSVAFEAWHQHHFGFLSERPIMIDEVILTLTQNNPLPPRVEIEKRNDSAITFSTTNLFVDGEFNEVNLYQLNQFKSGDNIEGPAVIIDTQNTIIVEENCSAKIDSYGDIYLHIQASDVAQKEKLEADAISLSIYSNLFTSIANQMGSRLKNTAVSTNIKERLDFSCAIFDASGELIANAPHVPVHLGSMSYSVKAMLKLFKNKIQNGDVFITNDPNSGGSHLPDLTIITPVLQDEKILYIFANRGHHADIGGIAPGSMPSFSQSLEEEGALFKMQKCMQNGVFGQNKIHAIFEQAQARNIDENMSDIKAQIASNQRGVELLGKENLNQVLLHMQAIMQVSAKSVATTLKSIASKKGNTLYGRDFMDDGTQIGLEITIDPDSGSAQFDFSKTDPQSIGNQNTPISITASAVVYALRCLIDEDLPLNGGFMQNITIVHKRGTLLNPREDAAVVGGNVTTSQRIVDVILQAFGGVAASCGCMNNFSFGNESFGYYETIAGGSGAGIDKNGKGFDGASAVHTHMTNTKITDPEVLERRYPVILREFSIRKGSGGEGAFKGGDGVVREMEFLDDVDISLLSERRVFSPWGLEGAQNGERGINLFTRSTSEFINLSGKIQMKVGAGESVRIETPGGGGYGEKCS